MWSQVHPIFHQTLLQAIRNTECLSTVDVHVSTLIEARGRGGSTEKTITAEQSPNYHRRTPFQTRCRGLSAEESKGTHTILLTDGALRKEVRSGNTPRQHR